MLARVGVLCLLVAFVVCQTSPPFLQGTYNDDECHSIPNSKALYQKRTIVYGVWNNTLQQADWTITTNVYSTSDCDANFQNYKTIYSGSYTLTGKESEYLPLFWHIEYRLNAKTMEVYTDSFANEISSDASCNIPNVVPNALMSIRHANCPHLQIVPIEDCVIFYDIVRKEGDRIWVGNQFGGDPVQWVPNCYKQDRPSSYDAYSLTISTAVDPYPDAEANIDYFAGVNADTSDFANSPGLGISYSVNFTTYGVVGIQRHIH